MSMNVEAVVNLGWDACKVVADEVTQRNWVSGVTSVIDNIAFGMKSKVTSAIVSIASTYGNTDSALGWCHVDLDDGSSFSISGYVSAQDGFSYRVQNIRKNDRYMRELLSARATIVTLKGWS